jgi:hypothetical protein
MFAAKTLRSLRWMALVAAVAFVSACPATEPSADERPFSITIGPDTTALQSGLTTQLTAQAKNQAGANVDADIVFTSTDSTIGRVDQSGVVTGHRAGRARIIAAVGTLADTAIVNVTSGAPAVITQQSFIPGTPTVGTETQIQVRVVDAAANVVPNATVNFAITAGGGSVTPASASTNALGVATTVFKMGTTVGTNTATASVAGASAPVTFTTPTVAGASAIITKLSSDPSNIVAGDAFGETKVKVTDEFGNPKGSVSVTFAAKTGGGSMSPGTAITNSSGEASSTFTTGKVVGENTATAAVQGISTPTTFTTTTIPGSPAKVKVSVPIITVAAGASTAVTASVADANNNATTGTLTFTSRSTGVATVSSSGDITGVAKGQTFIVAEGTLGIDSLLVVVREAEQPVLLADLAAFAIPINTDLVVTVVMDMTGSSEKLGATTVKLEWDPNVVSYRSQAAVAGGPTPTVNTTQTANGSITFSIANSTGLTGRVQLIKVTLRGVGTAGKSGALRLIASESTAAGTYVDLLPKTIPVSIPIITK